LGATGWGNFPSLIGNPYNKFRGAGRLPPEKIPKASWGNIPPYFAPGGKFPSKTPRKDFLWPRGLKIKASQKAPEVFHPSTRFFLPKRGTLDLLGGCSPRRPL